jgi:hypothetical protein
MIFFHKSLLQKVSPLCKISVAPHGSHLVPLFEDEAVHVLDMVTKEFFCCLKLAL